MKRRKERHIKSVPHWTPCFVHLHLSNSETKTWNMVNTSLSVRQKVPRSRNPQGYKILNLVFGRCFTPPNRGMQGQVPEAMLIRFIVLCSVQAASALPPPPPTIQEHPDPHHGPSQLCSLLFHCPAILKRKGATQTHLHQKVQRDQNAAGVADEGYERGWDRGSSSVSARMKELRGPGWEWFSLEFVGHWP
jgi:hypothetical protein